MFCFFVAGSEVCYKYQPSGSRPFSPFLPPKFCVLTFSIHNNDSRDKFQLKDLQAVTISYTKDASPEKVLEKHTIEAATRNLFNNYSTNARWI